MRIRDKLDQLHQVDKDYLKGAASHALLGLLFGMMGSSVVKTKTFGKYHDFPAFEWAGWFPMIAGVIVMGFGLYKLFTWKRFKKE